MEKTINVLMLETTRGSPDGVVVKTYEADVTYPIPMSLATVFVEEMSVGLYADDKETEVLVTFEEPEHPKDHKAAVETPERPKGRRTRRPKKGS